MYTVGSGRSGGRRSHKNMAGGDNLFFTTSDLQLLKYVIRESKRNNLEKLPFKETLVNNANESVQGNPFNFTKNCQNTAVTFEARMRGYDVIARRKNPYLARHPEKAYKNAKVTKGNTGNSLLNKINNFSKKASDGARGQIVVLWNNKRYGHTFNFVVHNGKPSFLDAQTHKKYNASIFSDVEYGYFFRTDNLKFSNIGKRSFQRK